MGGRDFHEKLGTSCAYDAVAQKRNVLLVDDDLTVCQSLQQVLMKENFHVVTASSGPDAMWEFGRNPIDVVLLDMNLGLESGWNTFEKLRTIRPRLPIILMTGHPQEQRPRPIGGTEVFMEKPLDLPELLSKLEELSAREPKAEVA
jgi:DNA-binding response OmpR family regulator